MLGLNKNGEPKVVNLVHRGVKQQANVIYQNEKLSLLHIGWTMINIYFETFRFFNKISNYFYNKYCRCLQKKQIDNITRVVK